MSDAQPVTATLVEKTFRHIAETQMAGVPVCNPRLGVAMRGWRALGEEQMGVLITPWFMNLMIFPPSDSGNARRVGTASARQLPAGTFDSTWGYEQMIGGYWSVSLFSPMNEFADMAAAVDTADAALEMLFAAPPEIERAELQEAMVQPAAARDVAARLAEEEAAAAKAAAQREAGAARDTEMADRPASVDRRALFGLRRTEVTAQ
ncbi:MAG: [NiFe]-hydrogenase assembly chaperone HybE [Pseudomonadota bacterium]